MDAKEIQNRLEITKLAAAIGDFDTIVLQTSHLRSLNNQKIDEIITLLTAKNYRQAIYLIKSFLVDNNMLDANIDDLDEDGNEKVLDIEDMLRMSPLAKETIKEYKSSAYTEDDLAAFAKNIETPVSDEYEKSIKPNQTFEDKFNEIQDSQSIDSKPIELKEIKIDGDTKEFDNAVESADHDTPLDEISAEVLNGVSKPKRAKVLSKYKTLRSKFAKKDKSEAKDKNSPENTNKISVAKSVLDKAKGLKIKLKSKEKIEDVSQIDATKDKKHSSEISKKKEEIDTTSKSEEKSTKSADVKVAKSDDIYPPIPHIEEKFRQAFVLYPPNKESEVWIEEVIKFLKYISSNSYTDNDVKSFLDEYSFYIGKGDIARAAQVLLLAAASDSKYAQFVLARELFNGRVLKRDLKKSHTVMKFLASKEYPDAFCDLAQFYEYGIGVPKDKKTALKLYEKAFELGVDRATKHINRIKESGGLLSSLFK